MMKVYNETVETHIYVFNHWWLKIRQNQCVTELRKHQRPDVDNIYLYVKDPFKSKYQLFINGREKVRIKHEIHPKTFIDYSQTFDDVYENLGDYKPITKRKVLTVLI